ncbi:MAG: HNH endonuclease [Patescibacteria group bacterium]|nr:HNH endonuclease [Patescibacteria group bacterium]
MKPLIERFEEKYIPEPNSGCWLWIGSWGRRNYGGFRVGEFRVRAHRVSWKIYRGPIPKGMHVLHSCDVAQCVNPDHLHLGTHVMNMAEMAARHRAAPQQGDLNANHKLSASDIPKILAMLATGKSQSFVAAAFGVRQAAISKIYLGKAWQSVPRPAREAPAP